MTSSLSYIFQQGGALPWLNPCKKVVWICKNTARQPNIFVYPAYFIALIHPIQWTIANPVGTDRPAKRQKKSPYMSA